MRRITGLLYIEIPKEEYDTIKDLDVIFFNIGKYKAPTFGVCELM